jgi:hypothetical protein
VPPGQYLPPPSADIPPLPGKQPKRVKVSRKALAIERLRQKIVWLERIVEHDEIFIPPELPDKRGRIKCPDAMTTINLLCVLVHEPVSGELELSVRAQLAGIAQELVFVELLSNQITAEFKRRVARWQSQTRALQEKFLNNHFARYYANAELGARKIIDDLYGTTLTLHESIAASHMANCVEATKQVMGDLATLLEDVRHQLRVLLTTPIPVGDNTPTSTDTE